VSGRTSAFDPDAREGDAFVSSSEDALSTHELRGETMVINMGPQHPSTHGVLRLLLELDGETLVSRRPIVGTSTPDREEHRVPPWQGRS
jgi:hypothetical protein